MRGAENPFVAKQTGRESSSFYIKTEQAFALLGFNGGEGGIRTHGELSPTKTFEVFTLNRSDTSPISFLY